MTSELVLAFSVTLAAGLATGIGSAIAFFTTHTNRAFFAISIGFSAGVMIYLSFVEILPKATEYIGKDIDSVSASVITTAALIGGMILMALLDFLVPSAANPHENTKVEIFDDKSKEAKEYAAKNKLLLRTGVVTALAIAMHNFPEGLATFLLVLDDPAVGIALAVAVAMHNIPEGIAVSVPVYYATKSRAKAFRYSFLSGLSEPAGAVIGFLILAPFLTDFLLGIIFAGVGGVMVFLAIDTLLPTARNSDRGHLSVYGVILGILVMSVSLILFQI